jgi:hypothetical protein
MNTKELSVYTYYAEDPTAKYKGYSSTYTSGCKDSLITGYGIFAHSDGNSQCEGTLNIISQIYDKNYKGGANGSGVGCYQYGFIYVR